MKNFRLIVPKKQPKLAIEPKPLRELPDNELPRLGKRIKAYKPIPTTIQWKFVAPQPSVSDYTQHRQQDSGRGIALGKDLTNVLSNRQGNIWTFTNYFYSSSQLQQKTYTVTWDGIGTPPAGVSSSTYSQGPSYYRQDGTFAQLQGRPDKFTWAVWFLVNGIPSDDLWPPIPSRNPSWLFTPAWPEYNLNL